MRITCLILFLFMSTMASAKSSVWKISKDGQYFYLGGTVHLLKKSDHPLPKEFMKAYQDSDKLIFEADIGKTGTLEAQQKAMAIMMDHSGKTLSDTLNKSTYNNLKSHMENRGVPIAHLENFQPWAAAITLSVMEYQKLGMQSEYGVDQYFYDLAKKDKKSIGALETLEQQMNFMASMGNIEPNLFINYTLRDLKELPKIADTLTKSWRTGNLKFFTENTLLLQSKTEFPSLYDTLLTKRNNNWMPELSALVKDKQKEFVLVGTMHLTDTDGLLNQLKKAGFKVEQL